MKALIIQKKRIPITCLLLPFFTGIIVYLNCLHHSFVYDDGSTITDNYFIRHWSNIPYLFTSKYFTLSAELTYRPVVTLSYFADYTLWHLNPAGYHLTNILLHATNSTLVFIFAYQIFRQRTPALISSVFFSTYPLFTEAVNAIGFREDLWTFMFLILAFICYMRAIRSKYLLYYPISMVCFLLSLFSKEMAITLPVLIILHDIVFRGFSPGNKNSTIPEVKLWWKRTLLYYMGYFFIATFYILTRFFLLYDPKESQIPYPQNSFLVDFLTMPHVLAYYLKLLFMPFNLNADYVVPLSASPLKISFWLSILLFAATGILSVRIRSQYRYVFFFIIWFFITLTPVMNVIPLRNIMAERYLYIPGAGFSMIIACLISSHIATPKPSSPFLSYPLILILSFILIGNACLTIRRNNDWKDGLSLWSKTISTSPNSVRTLINLGNAYEREGLNTDALNAYNKAVLIDPNDADIYNNIGICYDNMNLPEDAVNYFIKSLNIDPRHKKAYNNLGVVFTKQRRLDDAIQAFKQAIAINPLYPDAHNNLGIAYYRKGLMDDAEREFKLTISIESYHAEAHNVLGILYNDRGLFDGAIREFEMALQIKPHYANAHINLGAVILKYRKDKENALRHLKESIKLDPNQAQAAGIHKLIQQLELTQ